MEQLFSVTCRRRCINADRAQAVVCSGVTVMSEFCCCSLAYENGNDSWLKTCMVYRSKGPIPLLPVTILLILYTEWNSSHSLCTGTVPCVFCSVTIFYSSNFVPLTELPRVRYEALLFCAKGTLALLSEENKACRFALLPPDAIPQHEKVATFFVLSLKS